NDRSQMRCGWLSADILGSFRRRAGGRTVCASRKTSSADHSGCCCASWRTFCATASRSALVHRSLLIPTVLHESSRHLQLQMGNGHARSAGERRCAALEVALALRRPWCLSEQFGGILSPQRPELLAERHFLAIRFQ